MSYQLTGPASTWSILLLCGMVACGPRSDEVTSASASADPPGRLASAIIDGSSPAGTWYLRANGFRLEMTMTDENGAWSGFIRNEGAAWEALSNITWDPIGRWLEFRRNGPGFFQWYRVSLTHGVVAGRFSHSVAAGQPARIAYTSHVTGWSPTWIDNGTLPRTWNVKLNDRFRGVLRIDNDEEGNLSGRLKVFDDTHLAGAQEELENDLTAISWDGTNLSFTRSGPGFTQVYTGTANGRFIAGTFTHNGGEPVLWNGARGEVLGFGLGSRHPERATWQEQTRARVVNLTEGLRLAHVGVPAISAVEESCSGCPFLGTDWPAERDDDPENWPASYTLKRYRFTVSPGSRFDPANPPPPRVFYGYLATPTWPMPPDGFRAVVAVNGHQGSAQQLMTAESQPFWHGESAARRGLVVLALDIGHRTSWPWWDGDSHPIRHENVIDTGYTDSNWEEDGERAFSVRRAIDWLSAQPFVRADRIFLEGLSLGGEVATITAGLDPRVAMVLASGYSPDMNVMDNRAVPNHACYKWTHADIHEYLDVSDYEALIAPRPLVIETGMQDWTFAEWSNPTPWAADKQVTRRARAAYGADTGNLIHYLHYDGHNFHVGDRNAKNAARPQGVLAASVTAPIGPGDLSWQTDTSTSLRSPTIYHLMNEFLP